MARAQGQVLLVGIGQLAEGRPRLVEQHFPAEVIEPSA